MLGKIKLFFNKWWRKILLAAAFRNEPKQIDDGVPYVGRKVSYILDEDGSIVCGKIVGVSDAEVKVEWETGVTVPYNKKHHKDHIAHIIANVQTQAGS